MKLFVAYQTFRSSIHTQIEDTFVISHHEKLIVPIVGRYKISSLADVVGILLCSTVLPPIKLLLHQGNLRHIGIV